MGLLYKARDRRRSTVWWTAALALQCSLLLATPKSWAQGLMVLPVNVQMGAGQDATTLTVTNKGEDTTAFQVRAYAWSQNAGTDELLPTDVVRISPPIATIGPRASQVVRIVLRERPHNREATYRLVLDQIPAPAQAGKVQLVLRLSIPIFAQPTTSTNAHVRFHVEHKGEEYTLVADNDGAHHEKVRDALITADNGFTVSAVTNGSPYILAGATRHWPIVWPQAGTVDTKQLRLTAKEDKGQIQQALIIEDVP